MTNRILGVISHSGNPDSLIEAHQALTHRSPMVGVRTQLGTPTRLLTQADFVPMLIN